MAVIIPTATDAGRISSSLVATTTSDAVDAGKADGVRGLFFLAREIEAGKEDHSLFTFCGDDGVRKEETSLIPSKRKKTRLQDFMILNNSREGLWICGILVCMIDD